MLPAAVQPFRPLAFLVIALLFLVSESIAMHVEFRQQTYSWSLAELALTIALVEVGGLWATVAWVLALAILLTVQAYSPAKVVFNLAMPLVHVLRRRRRPPGTAAGRHHRAAGLAQPRARHPRRQPVVGALMISGAIIGTAGYPGPQLWRQQLVPIAVVSPVVVSVGIIALLLSSLSAWAWLLIVPVLSVVGLLFRRFGTVAREGNSVERVYDFARRVEQVSPDEAGTAADRRRRSASCSTPSAWRSGCRPTSTRSRAWSSPPRTARSGTTAPATRTTSSAAARWPPPRARCSSRSRAPTTRRRPPWPAAASPTCSARRS